MAFWASVKQLTLFSLLLETVTTVISKFRAVLINFSRTQHSQEQDDPSMYFSFLFFFFKKFSREASCQHVVATWREIIIGPSGWKTIRLFSWP